jgi:hypothetical protein
VTPAFSRAKPLYSAFATAYVHPAGRVTWMEN